MALWTATTCCRRTTQFDSGRKGLSAYSACPMELAAYLCDLADTHTPSSVRNVLSALRHSYQCLRPDDNPSVDPLLRHVMAGLCREYRRVQA